MFNFFRGVFGLNNSLEKAKDLNKQADEIVEKVRRYSEIIKVMENELKMRDMAYLELKQRAENNTLYNYDITEIKIGRYLCVPKDLTHCPTNTGGAIGRIAAIDLDNDEVTLKHGIANSVIARYHLGIWVKF